VRLTFQYIPLNKIKPGINIKLTEHVKMLRNIMWDCMHVLVVKKDRNDGRYTIISGHDRFDHLLKHTKHKSVPCIINESTVTAGMKHWLNRIFSSANLAELKLLLNEHATPKSWSIIRSFLKEEPRLKALSPVQQIKVLILAVRYKKTVKRSMKKMVDEMHRKNEEEKNKSL
jgi:hypothetical protein